MVLRRHTYDGDDATVTTGNSGGAAELLVVGNHFGGSRANFDEFMAQVRADELADKAASVTKMTPIEYAKARGLSPQKVYYYLRKKTEPKLVADWCECGRKVIVVKEADELFQSLEAKQSKIPLEHNQGADDEDQ